MDITFFESLLYQDESATLDFKQAQYLFAGASNDQKGELLKDILAFANAWRQTDAYILIGVSEVKGGKSIVVGVSEHLPEHALQQFVNAKVNRPLHFSYQTLDYERSQVGVIHIPIANNQRPFFLNSDYGKLQGGVVYIRRGSSTDQADPDEVAAIGAAERGGAPVPTVEVEFIELGKHNAVGRDIEIRSSLSRFPPKEEIPAFRSKENRMFESIFDRPNKRYYRDYANYFFVHDMVRPVAFILSNTGGTLLTNARMVLNSPESENVYILGQANLPKPPIAYPNSIMPTSSTSKFSVGPSLVAIERKRGYIEAELIFGNVQPKANSESGILYLGSEAQGVIDVLGTIYADNLPDPVSVPFTVNFSVIERDNDLDELYRMIKEFEKLRTKQFKEILDD